jgi:quercetin dioxygenase-like cupin family protein
MPREVPIPLDMAAISFESINAVALARELLRSEQSSEDGRAAQTLAKSKGLTTVLTAVPAGGHIGEHRAPGPVIIVPLIGSAVFSGGSSEPRSISVGQALLVGEGQKHQVTAHEDCAFLIVIGLQT